MSYSGDTTSSVTEELMMIGYLCGYAETPNPLNLYGLMKQCISIGPYGWGLALMALTIALSGGTVPFHAVMPLPHGALGNIRSMCVVEDRRLAKEGLIEGEGYFTSFATHRDSALKREVYIPNVFAVCFEYEDMEGDRNARCFMVRMTMNEIYPFMATIPPDRVTKALIKLCSEGRTELTGDEYAEFMSTYGQPINEEGEEGKTTLETFLGKGEEVTEEELVEEEIGEAEEGTEEEELELIEETEE